MSAALSVMIFLAAVLAKDIRHLDDHALEQLENKGLDDSALATDLDCPMVDVRIQGSLTGMQPGVLIWEECGEQKYFRNCLIKAFFQLRSARGFQRASFGRCHRCRRTTSAIFGPRCRA